MHRWTLLISCLLGMALSAQAAVVAVLDYEKTHGSKGLIETLRQDGSHEVKVIAEIAEAPLQGVEVLIISHMYDLDQREVVREFVRQGGGVLLTHDAAGSGRPFGSSQSHRKAESTFPEICHTPESGNMLSNPKVRGIRKHPITEGIAEAGFDHTYSDHATLFPVDDRMVVMEDVEVQDNFVTNRFRGTQQRWDPYLGGNAVLIASPFGRGRVVLAGVLLGFSRDYKPVPVKGAERKLLFNTVNWLAGMTPLGVPKTLEPSTPSKYVREVVQQAPIYREKAILVETRVVARQSESGSDRQVQFQLPLSVSPGRSVPVIMDLPAGSSPQTVSIVQADGTTTSSVPVQVEKREDGAKQLVFIESFPARDVTAVFGSGETSDLTGLDVRVNAEGSLAKITGPHFSLLVSCEGDEPTLQCARIHDWDWHHIWEGQARNGLSAPVLRLAESLWPFKAVRPSIDHEVGLPFDEVQGDDARTSTFPVRVTLQVGKGRLTVYRTGQLQLENFTRSGRIATFLVDRYVSGGKNIPETVSYDLPAVRGPWLWAQRDHRYAIGGTFHVLDQMGETGLAPGMERKVSLQGETLVLTTDIENLERYQVPVAISPVKTTDLPSGKRVVRRESETPLTHPTIRVWQRRLWKMRGTDEFFEILAQPVEIYRDLLAKTPPVARWEIQGSDVLIGACMAGPFDATVEDPQVIEGMKKADPGNEDPAVWRRVYVRCREITDMKTLRVTLQGSNERGETVVEVPVEVNQALSLPVGIFTYGPMWAGYWQLAGQHNGRCPPEQWPKIVRNIAMGGLDYIIHTTQEEPLDGPAYVQSRLERYGLWWMASLMQAYHSVNSLRNLNQEGEEHIEQHYSEHISRWKDAPNIIAWYLSDEIPNGECENGILNGSYRTVSVFYDLCRKYDGTRPAINLLTPHATPYETSTVYLPSDAFSWDPYGLGADHAYETAATVDTMWRKTKNKPSWITLRACGPGWIDCLDLWLDIRRRSLASVRGNVDGINYFNYAGWERTIETHPWYAVVPGTRGAIATPRWQALNQVVRDIDRLITAEYLLGRCRTAEKKRLMQQLDEAKLAGQEGKFYQMRTLLNAIIRKARPK